jgi:hypothetical protein
LSQTKQKNILYYDASVLALKPKKNESYGLNTDHKVNFKVA